MRLALIDVDKMRLLIYRGRVLLGECKRCGECCRRLGCKDLGVEIVDNKPRHFCKIYWGRPARCAFYPLPDERREDCGLWWGTEDEG